MWGIQRVTSQFLLRSSFGIQRALSSSVNAAAQTQAAAAASDVTNKKPKSINNLLINI